MVGTKGHKVLQNLQGFPVRELVRRLAESAETVEDKILVYGLLYTGMRLGELVHMRRSWVMWDSNIIQIPYEQPCTCRHCKKERARRKNRKAPKEDPDSWVLGKPANTWYAKTESARRSIPIAPEFKPILRNFFSKYQSVMDVYAYRELAWYRLKQLVKEAGIKWRIFPHLLRGCVASQLAGQGVDVYRLKERMGWKTIGMAAEYVKLFRPPGEDEVVKW